MAKLQNMIQNMWRVVREWKKYFQFISVCWKAWQKLDVCKVHKTKNFNKRKCFWLVNIALHRQVPQKRCCIIMCCVIKMISHAKFKLDILFIWAFLFFHDRRMNMHADHTRIRWVDGLCSVLTHSTIRICPNIHTHRMLV